MTALIDVVFLLIIFFMLVCQFIVSENYRLFIPDDCANAIVPDHPDSGAVTVSVFGKPPAESVSYAVRARRFDLSSPSYREDPDKLLAEFTNEIVSQAHKRTDALVHLRADRDLTYGQVQEALLAIAQAGITKVQLAAFQSAQPKASAKEAPVSPGN